MCHTICKDDQSECGLQDRKEKGRKGMKAEMQSILQQEFNDLEVIKRKGGSAVQTFFFFFFKGLKTSICVIKYRLLLLGKADMKNSGGRSTPRVLLSCHHWKIQTKTETQAIISTVTGQLLPLHDSCCRRCSPVMLHTVLVTRTQRT